MLIRVVQDHVVIIGVEPFCIPCGYSVRVVVP